MSAESEDLFCPYCLEPDLESSLIIVRDRWKVIACEFCLKKYISIKKKNFIIKKLEELDDE